MAGFQSKLSPSAEKPWSSLKTGKDDDQDSYFGIPSTTSFAVKEERRKAKLQRDQAAAQIKIIVKDCVSAANVVEFCFGAVEETARGALSLWKSTLHAESIEFQELLWINAQDDEVIPLFPMARLETYLKNLEAINAQEFWGSNLNMKVLMLLAPTGSELSRLVQTNVKKLLTLDAQWENLNTTMTKLMSVWEQEAPLNSENPRTPAALFRPILVSTSNLASNSTSNTELNSPSNSVLNSTSNTELNSPSNSALNASTEPAEPLRPVLRKSETSLDLRAAQPKQKSVLLTMFKKIKKILPIGTRSEEVNRENADAAIMDDMVVFKSYKAGETIAKSELDPEPIVPQPRKKKFPEPIAMPTPRCSPGHEISSNAVRQFANVVDPKPGDESVPSIRFRGGDGEVVDDEGPGCSSWEAQTVTYYNECTLSLTTPESEPFANHFKVLEEYMTDLLGTVVQSHRQARRFSLKAWEMAIPNEPLYDIRDTEEAVDTLLDSFENMLNDSMLGAELSFDKKLRIMSKLTRFLCETRQCRAAAIEFFLLVDAEAKIFKQITSYFSNKANAPSARQGQEVRNPGQGQDQNQGPDQSQGTNPDRGTSPKHRYFPPLSTPLNPESDQDRLTHQESVTETKESKFRLFGGAIKKLNHF